MIEALQLAGVLVLFDYGLQLRAAMLLSFQKELLDSFHALPWRPLHNDVGTGLQNLCLVAGHDDRVVVGLVFEALLAKQLVVVDHAQHQLVAVVLLHDRQLALHQYKNMIRLIALPDHLLVPPPVFLSEAVHDVLDGEGRL